MESTDILTDSGLSGATTRGARPDFAREVVPFQGDGSDRSRDHQRPKVTSLLAARATAIVKAAVGSDASISAFRPLLPAARQKGADDGYR